MPGPTADLMPGERVLAVGEVELGVQSFGDPAHPAMLLIMGGAASMLHWDEAFCEQLAAAGRYVIRYDHRDTGRSTTGTPGEPTYTGADLAADAARLLGVLGVERAHLVGMSMGAALAVQVALQQPELVATLTLIAFTSGENAPDGAPLPAMSEELAAFFAGDGPVPEDPAEALVEGERPFAAPGAFDEDAARERARRIVDRSHDVAAGDNHFAAVEGSMSNAPLASLRLPTLVVHGSADPLFPLPHGEAVAAAIPGAELLVLEGVGHEAPPPSTYGVAVPRLIAHTAR